MRHPPLATIALTLVAGCAGTVVPVDADIPDNRSEVLTGGTFTLAAIDEVPFTARATLVFGPGDSVGGQGPCNRWSADLISTWPDFQIGPIVATEMACDDLVAEMTYFRTLSMMSGATFLDGSLILTGYQGSSMVFQNDP